MEHTNTGIIAYMYWKVLRVFAHELLENLWHQFSILPVCGMAGWSWLWNGCHWHCRSRPLRGEVHRLDLKPLGSRMLQVTLIPSISIHLQHSTNSVAQRVGSIFVGCFAGWAGLLPPRPRRWSGPPSLNGLLRLRHFGCLPRAERDGMIWDDLIAFEEVS